MAESLQDTIQSVYNAFFEAFPPPQPEPYVPSMYVDDVLSDDTLIICQGDKAWKVKFTKNDKGEITFEPKSKWTQVEESYVPVKASVVAMKATADGWEIDILGVPFGGPYKGKDKDGEYFSERTNIHQEEFPTIPVVFAHGLDPETGRPMNPQYIGKAEYSHKDKRGHWYKAFLKKTSEFAKRIWEAAQKGVAGASSGSINHLTRYAKDGHIDEWPVTEMSLMDITGGVRPRNPYAVAMPVMKAMYQEAGIETKLFDSGASGDEASQTNQSSSTNQKGGTMTAEEQKAADEKAAQLAAAKAGPDSMSDDSMLNLIQRMKAEKDSAKKARQEKEEKEKKLMDAMKAVMEDEDADESRKGGTLFKAPAFNSKTRRGDNENDAFNYYLKTGDKGAYKALVIMNEGDDESGGAVVPTDFFSKVIELRDPSSVVRRMGAEIIPTSRLTINIPTEAIRLTAPAATNESAGATAVSRTINEVEPLDTIAVTVTNKTFLLRISEENLNDSAANIEGFIANRVAKNFAIVENSALKTAIYADVSNTVNAADDTTLAAADIFNTYYDLPEQYADGAVWLMKRATEGAIRQLTGSPFAFGATPQGTSDAAGQRTLLYNPVFNLADMDAIAASKKVVFFGDPYYVKLVQNGTMTIRRLNERYADTGEVGFVCSQRFAIKVIGGGETWTYLLTLAS